MINLTKDEIIEISSNYLQNRSPKEKWSINEVIIDNKNNLCEAKVSMEKYLHSNTDNNQFHFTIFSALEIASQLMIIYAHKQYKIEKKIREGWMIESNTSIKNAIRDPKNIIFKMEVLKLKKLKDNLYCIANYTITDRFYGEMKIRLKGFLS